MDALENSFKDFHAKGLSRTPQKTVKVYFLDGAGSREPSRLLDARHVRPHVQGSLRLRGQVPTLRRSMVVTASRTTVKTSDAGLPFLVGTIPSTPSRRFSCSHSTRTWWTSTYVRQGYPTLDGKFKPDEIIARLATIKELMDRAHNHH